MQGLGTVVAQFVLPLAVLVSAAATTATATFAWKLYSAVEEHERALFGEDRVDGHDGIVNAVNKNTERSEVNRRVLRAHDMVPPGQGSYYRGGARPDRDGDDEQAAP
jgi:hypothetical protein